MKKSLIDKLQPVKGTNFREFYHQIVYIHACEPLKRMFLHEFAETDTGIVAYGFIDDTAGLSFIPLGFACLADKSIKVRDIDEFLIIRSGALTDYSYLSLSDLDMDVSRFDDKIRFIRDSYDNQDREIIRGITELDKFRHEEYPDDLSVIMVREGLNPEQVWVRSNQITDQGIFCELLNEPYKDYGVHAGEIIQVSVYQYDDGEMLIAMF